MRDRQPTMRSRELGEGLRRAMEAAGLTGVEAARRLDWSPSRVSRMLSGTRGTTEVDAAMFLTVCAVRGRERKRLLAVCQDQGVPGWLQEYGDRLRKQLVTLVDHEDKAHGIPISISSCPIACMRRSARQRRSSLLPDRLNCTTSGSEPPIPFLPAAGG
jgi:transcriptional regulator with XRE-family HTH domain